MSYFLGCLHYACHDATGTLCDHVMHSMVHIDLCFMQLIFELIKICHENYQ